MDQVRRIHNLLKMKWITTNIKDVPKVIDPSLRQGVMK